MMDCCRCASVGDGEPSMEMDGQLMWTLTLPADNLDLTILVILVISN